MAPSKGQKLLVGENVEVRPLEEGLRGSWHAAVVIKAEHLCRSVEYRDFVTDEKRKDKYVERVQVTEGAEGLASRRGRRRTSYRNRIRPPPPPAEEQRWSYGLCVDAFYRDGWWEGVLLDDLQLSEHRSVLFPDEGDALTFHTSELRVTQDWDEKEGTWTLRGHWILATMQQDLERPALPLGVLWYHLRQRSTFILNLGQWTAAAGNQCKWLPYLNQVVRHLVAHPEKQTLPFVNSSSSIPMKLAYVYSHRYTSPTSCMEVEAESSDKALAVRTDSKDHFDVLPCNALGNDASLKDQMDATIGTEITQYCQPTSLNSNLTLDRNSNKQARNLVKMQLLALGWRFSFKPRPGKQICDLCYVSPSGRAYYSLYRAFVGWKKEQKAQGLVVRNNDVKAEESVNSLRGASASRTIRKSGSRATRSMLSSTVESKRLQRTCSSSEVVIHDCNYHRNAENASKINKRLKQSVNRVKRLYHDVENKSSGTSDMFNVPGPSHRTQACDLLPEHFDQPKARNISTKGARLRNAVQGSLVSSRKKQKIGSEDSLGVKRKRKSTNGFRMQVLLSAPGESKDSSSGKDKRNASSVLSWMIENQVVAEKQKVHYLNSQKEGWVTYEGILCACCTKVYSLTDFEVHAGSKRHRPSANIILEDGRTLLQCQMQLLDNDNRSNGCRTKGRRAQLRGRKKNHDECMICHVGGHLILCDHCPNSFHIECINLENVPKQEKWYCPTCRCAICGSSEFNGNPELFTELTVLFCDQCECQYHVGCLYERGMPKLNSCPEGNWFCSNKCSEVAETRFASHTIVMRRLLKVKDALSQMVIGHQWGVWKISNSERAQRIRDLILNESWWARVAYVLDFTEPIMTMLRFADIDTPCLGDVYDGMDTMFEKVKHSIQAHESDPTQCEALCKQVQAIINHRWNKMTTPLHLLAYGLSPRYYSEEIAGMPGRVAPFADEEVAEGCHKALSRLFPLEEMHEKVWEEFGLFASGLKHSPFALKDQNRMGAITWWYMYGQPFKHLQPLAIKVLSQLFSQLRNLVGVVNPMGVGGLSWTLLRSIEGDVPTSDQNSDEVMAEYRSKLSVAVSVMHECFAPMIETTTKKDIIKELIFNKGYDGNWLNFRGFYTMVLQIEDDFVSVATVRIYGQRVAEMPLIGTRIKYRYQGMCRLLVKELEKLLLSLGVERLILPAVSELKQTWLKSFGFQEMTSEDRFELLKHNFMNFPDTTVLQKVVARVTLEHGIVTETDASQNGIDANHPSPGSRLRGEGNKTEIIPSAVVSSPSNNRCYTDVAENVSPLCSLPFDTPVLHCSPEGEGSFDEETMTSLAKRYLHINSTSAMTKNLSKSTMEDEIIGGARSTYPLVRKMKWKAQLNDHELSRGRRGRRTEETFTGDKCLPICLIYPGESAEHQNIQFGACEIREPDEDISILWSRKITIGSEGHCLSSLKESAPSFHENTSLEDGSNHVAEDKEIECSNFYTISSKHHRENTNGYANCLESFKYCYSRRRKQVCAGSGLSGEIPSVESFPVKSSILHSSTVC